MAYTADDVNKYMDKSRFDLFDLGEGVTAFDEYELGTSKLEREKEEALKKYGKKQLWFNILSAIGNTMSGVQTTPENLAGSQAVERIRGRFGEKQEDLMRNLRVKMLGEEAEAMKEQRDWAREDRELVGKERERITKGREQLGAATRQKLSEETKPLDPTDRKLMEMMNFPEEALESEVGVYSAEQLDMAERLVATGAATPEQAYDFLGYLDEKGKLELKTAGLEYDIALLSKINTEEERNAFLGYQELKKSGVMPDWLTDIEQGRAQEMYDGYLRKEETFEMTKEAHEMGIKKDLVSIANSNLERHYTQMQIDQMKMDNMQTVDYLLEFKSLSGTARTFAIQEGADIFLKGTTDMGYLMYEQYRHMTPTQQKDVEENARVAIAQGAMKARPQLVKDKWEFERFAQSEAAKVNEADPLAYESTETMTAKLKDKGWQESNDGVWTLEGPALELLREYDKGQNPFVHDLFTYESTPTPAGNGDVTKAKLPLEAGKIAQKKKNVKHQNEQRGLLHIVQNKYGILPLDSRSIYPAPIGRWAGKLKVDFENITDVKVAKEYLRNMIGQDMLVVAAKNADDGSTSEDMLDEITSTVLHLAKGWYVEE